MRQCRGQMGCLMICLKSSSCRSIRYYPRHSRSSGLQLNYWGFVIGFISVSGMSRCWEPGNSSMPFASSLHFLFPNSFHKAVFCSF